MNEDEFFDYIAPYCDTIIRVEESQEYIKKQICNVANNHLKAFKEQVQKRIDLCKCDDEIDFVNQCNLTFLMAAIKGTLRDCYREERTSDDSIRKFSEHLRKDLNSIIDE